MRIYKRGIGILCAAALLALTGCQAQQNEGTTTEQKNPDTENHATKEDEAGTTETQQKDKGETSEPIRLSIAHHEYYNQEVEDGSLPFQGEYDTIECPDMNPEIPVVQAILKWSDNYEQTYLAEVLDYVDEVKDEENVQPGMTYFLDGQMTTHRIDSQVVSLSLTQNSFRGGVHSEYWTSGLNFDAETGAILALEDLGEIKSDVKEYVWSQLEKQSDEVQFFDNTEATVEEMIQDESICWYLTGSGIQVIFNPYEIATFASGELRILVPYQELSGMKPNYLPSDEQSLEYELLKEGYVFEADVDGDGETEELSVQVDYENEEETAVTVCCDTTGLTLTDTAGLDCAYVCRDGDTYYLLITTYAYGEYRTTRVYEFADDEPIQIYCINGGKILGYAQNGIWMKERIERLGTYFGYRYYTLKDGIPQQTDSAYVLANTKYAAYRQSITPNMGIPVKFRQELDGELQEGVLEAGTPIYPTIIYDYPEITTEYPESGTATVGFELEDGTYGELQVQIIDGMQYVNEINQFEMFADLPYAG